ncbi:MAG: hypothetical protein HY982_01630 [Candidatus Magasanikbacteria bacterium]|nr:hypothetical protein [Candidatus Magasanikbacteria bacterium]
MKKADIKEARPWCRLILFCCCLPAFLAFFIAPAMVYAEEVASSTEAMVSSTLEAAEAATSTLLEIPSIPDEPTETASSTEETTSATSTEATTQTNHVAVNYLNEEIFNSDVLTTSTWFYDSSGALFSTSAISALGVLAEASRQGNFPLTIQGGWGYYVSEINGHAAQGFDGWIYNINQQDPGWVGMNDYQIQNNDLLTVFYSVWPWKIESNTSSVYLGENVIFTAFNYASSTWQTSASTTVSINNQLFVTDDSGQYIYTPGATGTLSAFIYGSESWPQNSPTINVAVMDIVPTSTSPTTDNPPPIDPGGGGGGNGTETPTSTTTPSNLIDNARLKETADKILVYLSSQQDGTGKIVDGGITDWAIMSFGAANIYSNEIKNGGVSLLDYALNYDFSDSSEMNLCAAYPRHILALLAGGVDKTDAKIIELKTKIKNQCFSNATYGQNGINDDIFGLLAWLTTDESVDATSTQDIINSIKSDQTASGAFTWAGWPGADITGAALNALKYAETKGAGIEQQIYSNGKKYLKDTQLHDGGWGYDTADVLTTAWVIMGIDALGEGQAEWLNSASTTPWHVLVNNLKEGGFYESSWAPGTTDWFATKHAVPALLGKFWPIALAPKQQSASEVVPPLSSQNASGNGGGGGVGGSASSASATSTPSGELPPAAAIATSTPITNSEPITTSTAEKISSEEIPLSAPSLPVGRQVPVRQASAESALSPKPRRQLIAEAASPASAVEAPANTINISPASLPPPADPLLPIKKKVAESAVTGGAVVFAGTSLLLILRLFLAAL